ncbi:hypothetical protein [Nonomuraea indica]|uniref:hypothetical protein n=1 Tax=Nonomuraea indica TaxID=1581193 RepID=UPI000C7AB934|nr:hypothetical protein [Nonomuraea indica]
MSEEPPVRIVYSRSSTAAQSLLRQRHILTEAGLLIRTEGVAEGLRPAEEVLLFEDPATTSKIPALERPAFAEVAAAAHRGRPLALTGAQLEEVRSAFVDRGTSIAALARAHGVSRAAIRSALTGLLPGRPGPPVLIPTEDPAEALGAGR